MWLRQITDTGNNLSAGGTGTRGYPADYARVSDMAFCLDGNIVAPPAPVRPCCSCNSDCVDGELADCNGVGSGFDVAAVGESCSGSYTCPSEMNPANDECANATAISVGNNVLSTFCATQDGYNPVTFNAPGDTNQSGAISGDQWFEFVAQQDCTLRVDMCATGDEYDSALAVYSTGTGTCVCPLDQATHDATFKFAGDENCTYGEPVGGPAFVELDMLEGQCATIRVGFWVGFDSRGLGLVDVSCGDPICGDNAVNQQSEECDGIDDALCPGGCQTDCTCGDPIVCGDGVAEGTEECDGADDDACFGNDGCTNNTGNPDTRCRCVSSCGDNVKEGLEQCDGAADTSCGGVAGRCLGNCMCPVVVCGNNFKDPGEECDGTDNSACQGDPCKAAGDPSGECTCTCGAADVTPDAPVANTFGTCTGNNNPACDTVVNVCPAGQGTCEACNQNRYLSFRILDTSAGSDTAVRIRLDSLHNPTPPPQGALPVFDLLEGGDRWLNTVPGSLSRCCNPNSNPTSCNTTVSCNTNADCAGLGLNNTCYKNMCPDSTAFATYFRCGRIGCTPEYRDWSDYAGLVTYATGDAVIPSSSYSVSHLAASCAGNEASCPAASPPLVVGTERWGNVDCSNGNNGIPAAADIGLVTAKVRDAAGAFIKPRVHLRTAILDPISVVNAQDIGRIVDAVKGLQYPFNIKCTTATNCTTNAQCTAPATCSSNGKCTTAKDSCSGICTP
jgi:hypothetical protein